MAILTLNVVILICIIISLSLNNIPQVRTENKLKITFLNNNYLFSEDFFFIQGIVYK